MVTKIFVTTNVGELLGVKRVLDKVVKPSELYRAVNECGDDVLVLLDFLYPYVREIEETIKRQESRNRVLLIKLRAGAIARFVLSITRNPLHRLTEDRLAIGLYIPRSWCSAGYALSDNAVDIYIDVSRRDRIRLISARLPQYVASLLIEPFRVLRFGTVGFTGFLVNLLVLYTTRDLLAYYAGKELGTALATVLSFEVSLTWNFLLHEAWTFKDLGLPRHALIRVIRWIKYHVGSMGSMFTQVSVVTMLSGYMDYPLYLSLFIGVLLGLIVNYLLSRFFAWRK